jgi:hypothetical protein
MASTTYKLRVDWAGTGLFDQTGAELSARLLTFEYWRGRDYASSLIGKSVAGGLTAMLNNNSGDYSSFNTSSPLTGNVEPDKAVRLTATGRAAQFTAANSEYFTGGDVLDIATEDFSIAFWVYIDALGQFGIVNKRDRASATNLGYAIEAQSDGTMDLLLSDGTSVTTISSTTVLVAGTWNLCIVTADRSGNGQWYINDGAAEGAASIVSQNGTLANAIAFQVGAGFSSSADRFYGGRMNSVALWGKLLSSAERTFLHRDGDGVQYADIGLTGDGSTLKTSLTAWYDLKEESGNRADSENSNTLTDTNTVTNAEGIPFYSLWKGFIKEIEPLPSTSGLNRARLTAIGPLGQVNLNKIRLAMATTELTGAAVDRILTEAGWPVADRTTGTGNTTMNRFWIENEVKVIEALRRIEATEAGFIKESKDGRIVFEDRRYRQTAPQTISQATFSDAGGAALPYSPPTRQLNSQRQKYQIFTVPVQLYTTGGAVTLWTLSSSGASSPAIAPGQTLIFWAEYPNPDSATNAFGVDAWTTLVENTDYEGNTQAGGGGTDRSASMGIALTKFGNSMKIAITNNHATDTIFITLLQARGTPITRDDPSRITVESSANNPRTFPNPPMHLPSIQAAFDWANWHHLVFSKDQPLLSFSVLGNRSDAMFAEVLGRDISDRITLVANNSTGLGINEDFFIEREHHVIDQKTNVHRCKYDVSAVSSQDAWTLGVSALGTETRLAQ